ncbi:PAS domain-containing protein [Sphingosinicella humi]|nr:PAS domain-containing protein [Sphingosinicella humi]
MPGFQNGMNEPGFAILAPASDGALIEQVLCDGGHDCARIGPDALVDLVSRGRIGVLVVAETMLEAVDHVALRRAIEEQPTWSDLPILLLVNRNEAPRYAPLLDKLGQVRIVERPVEAFILERAATAALRSRNKQRGSHALLEQLEETQASYRHLSETLEQRIDERTRELEAAYDRLVREAEERRATEERLRESEELYRYTVELSQQLAWTAAPDGTILSISSRFADVTGIEVDPSAHDGWMKALHPDDIEMTLAHWRAGLASGEPSAIEFRMRVADGTYRTFRARAAPRRDEKGRILRWYGTAEDIEDQKRIDEERRAAEERYRLAAHAANDAIWELDLSRNQVHRAPSVDGFLGHPQVEATLPLAWWEEQLHPDDRERAASGLAAAIEGNASYWADSYRIRRADGDYAEVEDQGFIIRDKTGRAVRAVGAMTDITERRRAETELGRMQSDLIHVSRLSAMGAMASTLAHEINQPLTAITNYVRGSRRIIDTAPSERLPELKQALEAAEAGALRAGQIVRRLRELVARGNVSMRTEDLPRLIDEAGVLGFIDSQLLGISHRVDAVPAARWVYADRIQIQQVLINLIRNSVQAMKEQPTREIRISTALSSDDMVEVSVADTGIGLSPDIRDALFSPFRSTKAEGMGIGLSISRTIVEAHGGRIWAEDRKGGGTIFRFTLPRADEGIGEATDKGRAAEPEPADPL